MVKPGKLEGDGISRHPGGAAAACQRLKSPRLRTERLSAKEAFLAVAERTGNAAVVAALALVEEFDQTWRAIGTGAHLDNDLVQVLLAPALTRVHQRLQRLMMRAGLGTQGEPQRLGPSLFSYLH
jgi:hypothetical protein